MADSWYYAHDDNKIGPCSGQQLKDLAACGRIVPTDTIWKEGVEQGVVARKVKHLFAPVQAGLPAPERLPQAALSQPSPPPADARAAAVESRSARAPGKALPPGDTVATMIPDEADLLPLNDAPATLPPPIPQQNQVRKGRATAGKGAMIVGQDGTNVKYRKKCTTCGHLDSSWHTMPIKNGLTRVGFFCPKCRRNRGVEIQGNLS